MLVQWSECLTVTQATPVQFRPIPPHVAQADQRGARLQNARWRVRIPRATPLRKGQPIGDGTSLLQRRAMSLARSTRAPSAIYPSVAQQQERPPHMREVGGANPPGGTSNADVVESVDTPGREPGEPQGSCEFESRLPHQTDRAAVAQPTEHAPFKRGDGGLNPSSGTKSCEFDAHFIAKGRIAERVCS